MLCAFKNLSLIIFSTAFASMSSSFLFIYLYFSKAKFDVVVDDALRIQRKLMKIKIMKMKNMFLQLQLLADQMLGKVAF